MAPKVTQRAPKRGPERVLKAKGAPRASQRPPEGHFGSDFGAIFCDFVLHFFEYLLSYFCVEAGYKKKKDN